MTNEFEDIGREGLIELIISLRKENQQIRAEAEQAWEILSHGKDYEL